MGFFKDVGQKADNAGSTLLLQLVFFFALLGFTGGMPALLAGVAFLGIVGILGVFAIGLLAAIVVLVLNLLGVIPNPLTLVGLG